MADPLLERIRRSKALDLLMLPFEPGIITADHYEEALIVLYKKRWRFPKLRLMHYAIVAPALEMTFLPLPNQLTAASLIKRTLFLWAMVGGILWLLHEGLRVTDYTALFPFFCAILAASFTLIHALVAKNGFSGWSEAYEHIDHATLNSHYPKPKRKVKPVKKTAPAAVSEPTADEPKPAEADSAKSGKTETKAIKAKDAKTPATPPSKAKK